MSRRFPEVGLIVVTAACNAGHVTTHVFPFASYPPRSTAAELYMGDVAPPHPFEEIALVQAMGDGARGAAEDIAAAVRTRAGELGCDAVIRVRIDSGETRAHGFGICVRYVGDAAVAPPSVTPPS